ncbi:MAG: ABC transporter ATP-binding protein [Clostridia bacterium]|nr:ABC transporter ATP-binding protein [Clostridia bacterium]
MSETVIIAKKLVKSYNENTPVLKSINMEIYRGEWTNIMGPSGSGKTTLLNILSCLDTPTEGSVNINGKELTGLSQNQLSGFRRENVGLIFQQYHLVPYLTALENVMMAQYYHSTVDEEEAREALEKVGLGHRVHHIPAHLSGGEQQRVSIARALINKPKILLADEPTGNLDQKNTATILDLFLKLHLEGHTIVMVTHNPEIGKMGDRLLKLVDGRICDDQRLNSNH